MTNSFSTHTRSSSPPTNPPVVFSGNGSTTGFGSVGVCCTGQSSHR